jgi:hypothetical protein
MEVINGGIALDLYTATSSLLHVDQGARFKPSTYLWIIASGSRTRTVDPVKNGLDMKYYSTCPEARLSFILQSA